MTVATQTGAGVLVDSLEALGARAAFGVPGVHALSIWDRLRECEAIRTVPLRTELCAGFAADGYARVSGQPAVLLLSTGPGALISLAALMEAASAHVPVVAISSQIPRALVGRGRGFLHELPDQLGSFAPVVKWAGRADEAAAIPERLAHAWRVALTPPTGPVFLEVPVDVLQGPADAPADALDGTPAEPSAPPAAALDGAAALLASATRPVLWAGGGVLRAGAWTELAALAEGLDAPVATTYMGRGAIPEDHPLAAGSACDEAAYRELLEDADLLFAVGTELGAETTAQYELRPGRLIHADAAAERIGATYPALGLVGDAGATLRGLLERIPADGSGAGQSGADSSTADHPGTDRFAADRSAADSSAGADTSGPARAAAVRERIARGLAAQDRALEQGLLDSIRAALPPGAVNAWDMTILGYWAAAHFPALAPRRFLYPLGSGTLGYAFPAAIGAQVALPDAPALAVVGDGGALYGLQELAAARQHGIAATLLIVDDGRYGILREYQLASFGAAYAVDLGRPDLAAVCAGYGVPTRTSSPDRLSEDLTWGLELDGPAAIVLPAELAMWEPTA